MAKVTFNESVAGFRGKIGGLVYREHYGQTVIAPHAKQKDKPSAAQRDRRARFRAASNWKNGDVASFLYGALDYFSEKPFHSPEKNPSWKMFADFLYHGKIIE